MSFLTDKSILDIVKKHLNLDGLSVSCPFMKQTPYLVVTTTYRKTDIQMNLENHISNCEIIGNVISFEWALILFRVCVSLFACKCSLGQKIEY